MSSIAFAGDGDDFVLVGGSIGSQKQKMLIHEAEQRLSVDERLHQLEKRAEEQEVLIKKLTAENVLLQKTLGSMGNNRPVYQKVIPADAVFWVALGWTFLATYQGYNGNFITATTLFFTTFISIYWGLKEVRNIASIVANKP